MITRLYDRAQLSIYPRRAFPMSLLRLHIIDIYLFYFERKATFKVIGPVNMKVSLQRFDYPFHNDLNPASVDTCVKTCSKGKGQCFQRASNSR